MRVAVHFGCQGRIVVVCASFDGGVHRCFLVFYRPLRTNMVENCDKDTASR